MKILSCIAATALFVALTGCAKKEQQVDTVKLEASFSTADSSAKSEVDKVVAAVKKQDWGNATASLQKLAADAKLTDSQKEAVKDTLEDVGKAIKETASKALGEASKALGDAQKKLNN